MNTSSDNVLFKSAHFTSKCAVTQPSLCCHCQHETIALLPNYLVHFDFLVRISLPAENPSTADNPFVFRSFYDLLCVVIKIPHDLLCIVIKVPHLIYHACFIEITLFFFHSFFQCFGIALYVDLQFDSSTRKTGLLLRIRR